MRATLVPYCRSVASRRCRRRRGTLLACSRPGGVCVCGSWCAGSTTTRTTRWPSWSRTCSTPPARSPPCTDRASVAPASGADCAEGTCVPRTPPRAVTLQHTSRGCRLPRRLRDLGSSAAVGGQHGQARRHHHRRQRRFQQAPHPER